jgi:cell division protein FtsQ
MDPRILQRRVAVIRQHGRRRLRVVALVLAVVTVLVVAWMVLHSGLFSARRISVRGEDHTTEAQVLAASGLADHPPLLDIDSGVEEARIEALPWVAKAQVVRHWPDSVAVTVTERTVVAQIPRTHGVALVDDTGRVLAWSTSAQPGLVDLVTSIIPGRPGTTLSAGQSVERSAGRSIDGPAGGPSGLKAQLEVAGRLPPVLIGRVVQVEVTGGDQIDLSMTGGITAVLGPPDELEAKFEALAAVLAGANLAGVGTINVTVPEQPTTIQAVSQGSISKPA